MTFEARINGDPIYQGKTMLPTFDLSVDNSPLSIPFDGIEQRDYRTGSRWSNPILSLGNPSDFYFSNNSINITNNDSIYFFPLSATIILSSLIPKFLR